MFNKKENKEVQQRMSMVDILKHAFYEAPSSFYHLSNEVSTRLNVCSIGPIVTYLADLQKAAPNKDLEQEILHHIVRLGNAYDKEYDNG